MTQKDDRRPGPGQEVKGGDGGTDPGVVGDPPVPQRDVEVGSDEDSPALKLLLWETAKEASGHS